MEKKRYFVSMQSLEISQTTFGNSNEFIIYATDDEIRLLRAKFDHMREVDWSAFWRALVPIIPHHYDQPNDVYDHEMLEVFQLIHNLGDSKTRTHIDNMRILEENRL